jgi:hypothetical protein
MIRRQRPPHPVVGPTRPARAGYVLLVEQFRASDLARLRLVCYDSAIRAGLPADRALLFVIAIDRGLTSAIKNGSGRGVLVVIESDMGRLVAEIADPDNRHVRPATAESLEAWVARERELWVARQLVDEMTFEANGSGTTLRLAVAVDGGAAVA